jgi:hypothetical protein
MTRVATIAGVNERTVPFVELFNFRDLGGYRTTDGREVAWRRLFRSDDLGRLHGEDLARFTALNVRTVLDLRRPTEIAEDGRLPEIPGVDYHHLHLVHPRWERTGEVDLTERTAYLVARYGEMVASGGEAIGDALRFIAEAGTAPLVFHCMAGKDRTGIVAALVLELLGVDDETIAADYALSEASDAAYRARHGLPPAPYVVVPPAVMIGLLAQLRRGHGSVEGYVKSLGVTHDHLSELRHHLLS